MHRHKDNTPRLNMRLKPSEDSRPKVRKCSRQRALRRNVSLRRPERLHIAGVHVIVVVRLRLPQSDARVLERPDISVPADTHISKRNHTSEKGATCLFLAPFSRPAVMLYGKDAMASSPTAAASSVSTWPTVVALTRGFPCADFPCGKAPRAPRTPPPSWMTFPLSILCRSITPSKRFCSPNSML